MLKSQSKKEHSIIYSMIKLYNKRVHKEKKHFNQSKASLNLQQYE